MFIYIVFLLCNDRPFDTFVFRARFTYFHTHVSLLTCFCFIALFRSCCSHAQVFWKTLMHEFLISYSHTKWNLAPPIPATISMTM